VLERRTVHVLDASTDPEYAMPDYQPVAKNRTMLGVPLLRDGVPLGTITLWKTRVAQKRQLGESLSGLDLLALGNQDLADLIAVGVEVYDRLGARHNVTGDADRRGEAVAAGLAASAKFTGACRGWRIVAAVVAYLSATLTTCTRRFSLLKGCWTSLSLVLP
jgi:hypothetical protein